MYLKSLTTYLNRSVPVYCVPGPLIISSLFSRSPLYLLQPTLTRTAVRAHSRLIALTAELIMWDLNELGPSKYDGPLA